jgi:hypothetical protein
MPIPSTRNCHGPYTVRVHSDTWEHIETVFPTIRECRRWAEEWGTMRNNAQIFDRNGDLVARHCRDTSSDGTRWFRAAA